MGNEFLGFRSGGENSGTLEEREGLIEVLSSFLSVGGGTEEKVHNLVTEIPTILFPPAKHPSIGELSGPVRCLTH